MRHTAAFADSALSSRVTACLGQTSVQHTVLALRIVNAVLMGLKTSVGVVATHLFGQALPNWFRHLDRSLNTLFQVITRESWSTSIGCAALLLGVFHHRHPACRLHQAHLFVAIIVNAMLIFPKESLST